MTEPRLNTQNLAIFYEFDGNLDNFNLQDNSSVLINNGSTFGGNALFATGVSGGTEYWPPHGTYLLTGLDNYGLNIPISPIMSGSTKYSVSMNIYFKHATTQGKYLYAYDNRTPANFNTNKDYFHGFVCGALTSTVPYIQWVDRVSGINYAITVSDPSNIVGDNKINMWYNIAINVNGTSRKAYFNGRLITSDSNGFPLGANPTHSILGGYLGAVNDGSPLVDIFVKDFKIYNNDNQSSFENLGDPVVRIDVPDWTKYTVEIYDKDFNPILSGNPLLINPNPSINRWRIFFNTLPGYVRDNIRTIVVKKNGWVIAKKSILGIYSSDYYLIK